MTEKEIKEIQDINKAPTQPKKVEPEKKLITLNGITTSQVRTKEDTPAYCFLKLTKRYCKYCEEVEEEQFKCSHEDSGFLSEDIPVIFRIKEKKCEVIPCPKCRYPKKGNWIKQANCQTQTVKHQVEEFWIKPKIPKYSYLQVEGYFSAGTVYTKQAERKSFTAYSYQLLNQEIEIKGGENIFAK